MLCPISVHFLGDVCVSKKCQHFGWCIQKIFNLLMMCPKNVTFMEGLSKICKLYSRCVQQMLPLWLMCPKKIVIVNFSVHLSQKCQHYG